MSTEAKIKHGAIRADVERWRSALVGADEYVRKESLSVACDHIDELLAELCRNRRLLEAGERLAELLKPVADIIETVDNRCSAADGPVTPTEREITQGEMKRLLLITWAACEHARTVQAAYQEAAKA